MRLIGLSIAGGYAGNSVVQQAVNVTVSEQRKKLGGAFVGGAAQLEIVRQSC